MNKIKYSIILFGALSFALGGNLGKLKSRQMEALELQQEAIAIGADQVAPEEFMAGEDSLEEAKKRIEKISLFHYQKNKNEAWDNLDDAIVNFSFSIEKTNNSFFERDLGIDRTYFSYLLPRDKHIPKDGHGLYSILILDDCSSSDEKKNYCRCVIKSIYTQVNEISQADNDIPWSNINKLHIPVKPNEEEGIPPVNKKPEDMIDWILQHYDYIKAKEIHTNLPARTSKNYIFTCEYFDSGWRTSAKYLVWDFDDIQSEQAIRCFMGDYLRQVTYEVWDEIWKIGDPLRALPIIRKYFSQVGYHLAKGEAIATIKVICGQSTSN